MLLVIPTPSSVLFGLPMKVKVSSSHLSVMIRWVDLALELVTLVSLLKQRIFRPTGVSSLKLLRLIEMLSSNSPRFPVDLIMIASSLSQSM